MELMIKRCLPCQAVTAHNVREPVEMSYLRNYPWQKVAVDHAGPFPDCYYGLLVTDEYSRFPEIEAVTSTSMAANAPTFRKIFEAHGIPEVVKSDNGPPFLSEEFKIFAADLGFRHKPVTPEHLEANGRIENFVTNLNKISKTAKLEEKDWKKEIYTFLSPYRNTPHPSTGKTPNNLVKRYHVRTKIPRLKPDNSVRKKDSKMKLKGKLNAEACGSIRKHTFAIGETVLMKQRRLDKLTPLFEQNPYQITYIKKSRITTKRLKDGRYLTRNCTKVKPFFSAGMSSKDTDQTDFQSENSSDIDYSAAENNLPDHVINVEEIHK